MDTNINVEYQTGASGVVIEVEKGSEDHIALIYSLFGEETVLIPLPMGSKNPKAKGWNKTTLAETKLEPYQVRLRKGNVGVLVGRPSNGLCSIDCDSDGILAAFLKLNPQLASTCITGGRRGGNVWVKIKGDYPPTARWPKIGEWRSTNAQTVVWGRHPAGPYYRFINQARALEIEFSSIIWPEGCTFSGKWGMTNPQTNSSVSTVSVSSESCIPVSCIPASCISVCAESPYKGAIEQMEKMAELDSRLRKWKESPENRSLVKLYQTLIERTTPPRPNGRNAAIADIAPRLYTAVSVEIARQLLMAYYEINSPIFKDSRVQHELESDAMLKGLEQSFRDKLIKGEVEFYGQLEAKNQAIYRILRDLAQRNDANSPRGTFFMSSANLGERVGLSCSEADRRLKMFMGYEIISLKVLGQRRGAGVMFSRASEYEWKWPLPEVTAPLLPVPIDNTRSN